MKTIIRPSEVKDTVTNHQWFNAYLLIPKGHPLHGVYHEDIHHDCIIELSLSGLARDHRYIREIEEEDLDSWIIGFHTFYSHYRPEEWLKEDVENQVIQLKDFALKIKSKNSKFITNKGKPQHIKDAEEMFGKSDPNLS